MRGMALQIGNHRANGGLGCVIPLHSSRSAAYQWEVVLKNGALKSTGFHSKGHMLFRK
jgi:hypothetical protein